MRFSLIHVDDRSDEASVIVPGGERAAVIVPIDALPGFLPLLDEAIEELPEQCCERCGAPLPGLRRAEDEPAGKPH